MGVYNKMVITNAGNSLLAAATGGDGITYTGVKTGNGTYTGAETLETMTALKSLQQTFGVSGTTRTGNVSKLTVVMNNNDLVNGYSISEVGVFARLTSDTSQTPVLFAIMVSDEGNQDYFPPYAEAPTSVTLEVYLTMSSVPEDVTFEALPVAGTYATAQDLADVTSALADKADLDENGRVPYSQLDITIAPTEYNPSSTYQNGALTFHNGILYQNTSGSSVSGTWVEGYWSQVRIGNVATLSYTVVGTY